MKRSQAMLSHSPWPPLLWLTTQRKDLVAQELYGHKISIATFIKGQLESARKDTFALIKQTASLTEDDIKKIKALTCMVKEYDARAAQRSFLYRKSEHQEEMRKNYTGIEILTKMFKVDTDFNLYNDPSFHLDTYYDRSLKSMVFTIDDTVILAHPENNEYVSRPELTIGPSFHHMNLDEQWGTMARQVAGHIACEHAAERYLLKEFMKKRKTSKSAVQSSLITLLQLHELEADLIPAAHNADFAHYVLCWLKLQENMASAPCIKERILNVESVADLHVAYEAITNKKY